MIFLQGFIKFDQGISREIERTKMCGRIIIVKKKRRIAIRHPTEVRGDVITNNNIMLFSKISYSDLQLIFEFILCV
jgi:hypothetical protein